MLGLCCGSALALPIAEEQFDDSALLQIAPNNQPAEFGIAPIGSAAGAGFTVGSSRASGTALFARDTDDDGTSEDRLQRTFEVRGFEQLMLRVAFAALGNFEVADYLAIRVADAEILRLNDLDEQLGDGVGDGVFRDFVVALPSPLNDQITVDVAFAANATTERLAVDAHELIGERIGLPAPAPGPLPAPIPLPGGVALLALGCALLPWRRIRRECSEPSC